MAEKRSLQVLLELKDKFSKEMIKAQKSVSSFGSTTAKIGGILAGAFSVMAIKNFTSESLRMAQAQQVSEEKLASAISNVRGAREGDFEALLNQATALQRVTAIGDEEIINNQALLATFQLNGDAIQQLIPRILDMGAANAKTGQLTMDLQSATMAVGKAFTSGVGMLSRYGIAMSDAQKKAFGLADEEEKLRILTEVLDDNFKGASETIGQTFAGRVARAKNNINDLKEGIGFALMPTLAGLVENIIGSSESMKENNEWVNNLAKSIYRGANIFIVFGKSIKLIVSTLVAFLDTLFSVVKVVWAFDTDVVKAFWHIKDNVMGIIKAIGLALSGDIKGSVEAFKGLVSTAFENTTSEMDKIKNNTAGWSQELGDQYEGLGESMRKAIDLEGFKPIEKASVSAYKAIKDNTDKVGEELEEQGEDTLKLADKYKDLQEKASDNLYELAKDHEKNLSSIRQNIDETKASIEDLNASFEGERKSDVQRVAEEVISTEEKIADLKSQIEEETNQDKRKQLQDELSTQEQAMIENAEFLKSIDADIVEARRVAGLTDLERTIEEFYTKRELAQKEHTTKIKQLNEQLATFKLKEKQEMEIYAQKVTLIEEMNKIATVNYEKMMKDNFAVTKETIDAEIELYNRLAQAIAKVRGGSVADVNRVANQPVSSSNVSNGNTINNTFNGDLSGEDVATKIKESILRDLAFNNRITVGV